MAHPPSFDILKTELLELQALIESHPAVALMDGPQHNVALLSLALGKQVLTQGSASARLLFSEPPESAIPNVRSLLEAFGELHFLHTAGDREFEALVAYYFAVLEVIDTARKQGSGEEELGGFLGDLAEIDAENPAVGVAARSRRGYWTPRKRSELVYEAFLTTRDPSKSESHPDYGKFVYKLLSWDGHHVTAMLSAVESDPASPRFGMTTEKHPWPELGDLLALVAAGSARGVRELLKRYFTSFSRPA